MTVASAVLTSAEDANDIRTLGAAEARETEMGVEAARADNLADDFVGRLLAGEHPIAIWREHRGLTVSALAERADVARPCLTEIEALKKPGPSKPSAASPWRLGWRWTTSCSTLGEVTPTSPSSEPSSRA